MRVVIVAKTRRGAGACVGGITIDGFSVRFVAANAAKNDRAGLEYHVGEAWDIEAEPEGELVPPHIENYIVRSARRLGRLSGVEDFIRARMRPVEGSPAGLFDGKLQSSPVGALYVAQQTGLPSRSTMFWVPDRPLSIDCEGKRIRYRYPTTDGDCTLTFVGFQEPLEIIPAGALLRVSLANWWRPKERPEEEMRCYLQLSGWFLSPEREQGQGAPETTPEAGNRVSQTAKPCSPVLRPDVESGPEVTVDQGTVGGRSLSDARELLKQRFGFPDFLPTQQPVITRVLAGHDTLAVMPTGGGKSLCYQLPALLFDGLTVVVSPLIALMQDQVYQLRELGIPAAFLNSTLAYNEYVEVANRARQGSIKILYAAPETLLRPETLLLVDQCRLACLAVDEAHCISEWGHDFRPEYRQLHEVRARFPDVVCIALTATATSRVREDIRRRLNIEGAGEFIASFNRPNLFLAAQPRGDGLGQTLDFLERCRDRAGIIYCSTRRQVDELTAELQARNCPALAYHAGLDDETRRRNQDRFVCEEGVIMVATVAFGMGINKSNVRFVLHYNLPKDLESYYQEIGRAGRDGLPAECLLLHSRTDAMTIRRFITAGAPSEQAARQVRLNAMLGYAETMACRRSVLLQYFGEHTAESCGNCDRCLQPSDAKSVDVTEAARKFLSCVKRTGESFGVPHVIDVLRGSRSDRVVSKRHDQLSTYGIGRDLPAEDWRRLARDFIRQGILEQDLEFGSLRLTPEGWRVLKGEKTVSTIQQTGSELTQPSASAEHDELLFQRLRTLRMKLASESGVPPYVIFSDRTLTEMAALCPKDEQQFLAIHGVGQAKLGRYGTAFLDVIREYFIERGLGHPAQAAPSSAESTSWLTSPRRFQEVGEAFAAGTNVEQLAERYEIKRERVIAHLERFQQAGGHLDSDRLLAECRLPVAEREKVYGTFEKLGSARLAPVREALGGNIPYDELRLLRLYLNSHKP